ncbi:porin [Aquabacterium soli]|nr:porin [Aquabacterium soli]
MSLTEQKQPSRAYAVHAMLGAAACTLSSTVAMAQSDRSLTIYGRLNTGLEVVRASAGDSVTRLSNYRSVLGFRGEEALGGGLRALWQLEGSLALDTGAGSSFTNRDTRVGLAGPWGTAFAGVWTLPYNAATSGFDPFYPTTAGYMAIMGNGSASISDNVQNTSSFDRRQVNQLQYWSPRLGGVTVKLGYALPEETVAGSGARPWLASGSLVYEAEGLVLAAAVEHHEAYQARDTADIGVKLGAAYQWAGARLAAVVERLNYETTSGDLTRQAWYVSGTYRIGQGTLKAGYARAGNGSGRSRARVGAIHSGPSTGASQLTVGYDHELSRRTTLQAFVSQIDNQRQGLHDFAINEAGLSAGQRAGVFTVGMRHSF